MKVIVQDWHIVDWGTQRSISKDRQQLEATIKEVRGRDEGHEVHGEPCEAEVPDDHPFAHMVKEETVFLHPDEWEVVTFPE